MLHKAVRSGVVVAFSLVVSSLAVSPAGATAAQAQRPQASVPLHLLELTPQATTWDFETGDLRGWQATGTAFASQPTFGDNPRARQRETASHQGSYWIGTFERFPGPGRLPAGSAQGDRPQGTLTSVPFDIPGGNLSFLIGGGSSRQTRVELLVLDPIEGSIRVLSASGNNSETMRRQVWDLTPHAGKRGRIRIVDESSAGWGHINVDDFRFPPSVIVDVLPVDPSILRPTVPTLVVPPNEQNRRTEVPDIVGYSLEAAADILAEARLGVGRVGRQESTERVGTVLVQDPEAGSRAVVGSGVAVLVAEAPVISVPDVVGRSVSEANAILRDTRLVGQIAERQESRRPEATVLAQKPSAGTVARVGDAVALTVAIQRTVVVPNLVGRNEAAARTLLENVELVAGTVQQEESERPRGRVLSQAPGPGSRLGVGSPIDFVVATPITVAVPNLLGQTETVARRLLEEARLTVGRRRTAESRRPNATVLAQEIQPGTRVALSMAIDFVVAIPVTVEVPELVGRPEQEARSVLEVLELSVGTVSSEESRQPAGRVLSQAPDAGTRIAIDSSINLVVAEPVTVTVPGLIDRSGADALALLADAELVAGVVTRQESRQPGGSVLSQGIEAGTRVVTGTSVDLVLAIPVTVLVPALVGRSEDEARALLGGAELTAGTIEHQESAATPGTVLAQGLNPQTRVPITTPVALVVAVVETVGVPDVVGLPVQEARRQLVVGRLGVGTEEFRETRIEEEGTVLEQSWAAGVLAAVGTPVNLIVATPEIVAVPDVVGLSRSEAAVVITTAGLVVGVVSESFSLQAGGTVLSQAQAAGSQVTFNTAVPLQVARSRMIWAGPAVLLMVVGAATLVARRRPRRRRPPQPEPERRRRESPEVPDLPELEIRPETDPGTQRMETDGGAGARIELRLKPTIDLGKQEIDTEGDLIVGERRDHD